MKALVVYDSKYGNTEKVARAIAEGLSCQALHFSEAGADALTGVGLLVVGSPTQGGRPTTALNDWLRRLLEGRLRDMHAAAFDTRLSASESALPLRLLMGVIGFAAPKLLRGLQSRGARPAAAPEGFVVQGKVGPLKDGELERARAWGARLAAVPAAP
jgi:flavodoxin